MDETAIETQSTPEQVSTDTTLLNTAPQGKTGGWYESIADESLRGFVESKGFDSADKLAQSYQHAEKLLGDKVSATILPGEDATPEALAEFYTKLGRPAKPEDYKLDLPEGADRTFSDSIAKTMHEAGLNQRQVEMLSKHYSEYGAKQLAAIEQQKQVQVENEMTALKQEWAQNYDRNLELSRRAARALGVGDEMANKIQSAIGVKEMMSLFNKIGSGFSEDTFHVGGTQTSPFGMSVEAARAKLQEYKTNPTLRQAYLSGDVKAKTEIDNLNRVVAGAK